MLADAKANNKKRDRIPSDATLYQARDVLAETYTLYFESDLLKPVLQNDYYLRFNGRLNELVSGHMARSVIDFASQLAEARSVERVDFR